MIGRVSLSLSAALVCCLFTSTTRAQSLYSNWYLAHSITNPTPESGDRFGVAVSGVGSDKVLTGAPSDNTGTTEVGAAYLYEVVAPVLSIAHTPNPDIVRISWQPDTGSDLVLQVIPSLLSANWINAPTGTNNPALVPVAAASAERFFRLNKP